jgi:hypothetical protein
MDSTELIPRQELPAADATRLSGERETGFRVFTDPAGHPFCIVSGHHRTDWAGACIRDARRPAPSGPRAEPDNRRARARTADTVAAKLIIGREDVDSASGPASVVLAWCGRKV